MAIGRDVYLDTRIMIARLEELFPPSSEHPALSTKETVGTAGLLQKLAIESMFREVAKNIPSHFPLLRDEKFQKDRAKLFPPPSNSNKGDGKLVRPEAITHMRHLFDVVEALFADGREWVGGTPQPSLADLEGIWPLDWFITDLEPSKDHFSESIYPKVYAWRTRFRSALDAAKQRTGKPIRVKGEQAASIVTSSRFTDQDLVVDSNDPLKLKEGTMVEVYPVDYGGHFHQDLGRLIKLNKDEVAIAVQSESGSEVHIHAPRWQFRVKAIEHARL